MSARLVAMLAAMAVASTSPAAVGQQVFRARVDGVTVDVLVTRDRRPVAGLKAADFILRDNGVEQRIQSALLEDVPLTLLLVLDTSASVHGVMLAQLKTAARAAVSALRPIDRVGLFAFSHRVRLLVDPPAVASAVYPYLDALDAEGDTSIYDATFAALAVRERLPGRTLVLLFSDGSDTASWLKPHDVLAVAQRSDVVVHAVLVDPSGTGTVQSPDDATRRRFRSDPQLSSTTYLWQLVEDTGGVLKGANSEGLREAFVGLVDEFRTRYVLTYVPEGVSEKGWHRVEVQVRGRGMQVQARRGYLR